MKKTSKVVKLPGCSTGGGQYRYELRGPDGKLKQECDWTDNLLTDLGLVCLTLAPINQSIAFNSPTTIAACALSHSVSPLVVP